MLLLRGVVSGAARRCLATGQHPLQAASSANKTKLAKLRKLTGYSFVNCKKALQQHDYDLPAAEAWLRAQAQAEGWARANKLGARATPQGLVCVASLGRSAAMVELNCETDFVSRNTVFDELAREAATGCLPLADAQPDDSIAPTPLAQVAGRDGRGLPDHVALAIGTLGENVTLGRAALVRAGPATHMASYVHPGQGSDRSGSHAGRYAAVVLFEMFDSGKGVLTPHQFGRNLCQHIVGMAPTSLGEPVKGGATEAAAAGSATEAAATGDVTEAVACGATETAAGGATEAAGGGAADAGSSSDSDGKVEVRLLDQEYLVEPDLTVREYLAQNNARVVSFLRMECGETTVEAD